MRWKEDFLRTIKTGLKFAALEHCMMGAIRLQFEMNMVYIYGMPYAAGALTGFLIYSRCMGQHLLIIMMSRAGSRLGKL